MPESIEQRKRRRKRDAVRGVMFFAVLQIITSVACASLCFIPDMPTWAVVLCLVLAIVPLLLLIPAVLVLKSRFREIEGGELDAAAKY